MILITGGTGFIGNALVRQLSDLGHPIRLLLRPSQKTPNLPAGMPLDVAITSMNDEQGLRAAMKGVDAIYHLASAEQLGREAELTQVDILGTPQDSPFHPCGHDLQVSSLVYMSGSTVTRNRGRPLSLYGKTKAKSETVSYYCSRPGG